MSKRTKNVIMSNEAKVLRKFREKAGLSMRQAGEAMGVSSSLVSQIENGRENIPKGERLQRFLDCYGVGLSTFKKHVKEYQEEQTDRDVVEALLGKVNQRSMATLRVMVEHFVRERL
jgi:transcriptional regulator with XRE-family HTH domain